MKFVEEEGGSGFTMRAALIAIVLTLFLVATSSYIALKLGALPWPIIFSVIVSGAILKVLSNTNAHEINVAQAGGTIGGLLASGVVFTIPGIIFLKNQGIDINLPSFPVLTLICVTGGILGVLLSIPLRRTFVDEENLPYPSGAAGAEVLKAELEGGTHAFLVLFVGLIAAIFALLRDSSYFYGIPAAIPLSFLFSLGIFLYLYPMPLAVGVGYILGPKASVNSWFLGSLVGWVLIIPLLINIKSWEASSAISLTQNLGMGIVLGSGIGFFVAYVVPRIKSIFAPLFKWGEAPWYMRYTPLISLIVMGILFVAGIPFLASILSVLGVWIMATVAARMTGETNIDPLEQFGIMVGLLCLGIYSILNLKLSYLPAFLVVCFVSVACALSGDIGQDYKTAKIIGTRPKDIVKVDLLCAIFAGITAPIVLEIILKGFSDVMFTQEMPAPQAQLVAGSIFGFAYPNAFLAGFLLAFIFEVLQKFTKKSLPFSAMAFGIGMFLGLALSIPLALGGIIRYFVDRNFKHLYYSGLLASAGLMGGEGIAGFTVSAFVVAGFDRFAISKILILIFVALFALSYFFYKKKT